MKLRRAFLLPGLLLAGCATTPPSEDPVLIKLTEIDDRLQRVERVTGNDSLMQLAAHVDQMQTEIRELRGQVENLTHQSESAADRQRDQYVDIDQRLQSFEQRPSAPAAGTGDRTVGPVVATGGSASGTTDRVRYEAAFDLLKESRYEEARSAFQQFLVDYPDSNLAGHSQYWLAETYYVGQDYEAALPEFRKVLDRYPASRKIPDAMLKVGYCHDELGDKRGAREMLVTVTRDYPETTAARLAGQRLEKLDSGS